MPFSCPVGDSKCFQSSSAFLLLLPRRAGKTFSKISVCFTRSAQTAGWIWELSLEVSVCACACMCKTWLTFPQITVVFGRERDLEDRHVQSGWSQAVKHRIVGSSMSRDWKGGSDWQSKLCPAFFQLNNKSLFSFNFSICTISLFFFFLLNLLNSVLVHSHQERKTINVKSVSAEK